MHIEFEAKFTDVKPDQIRERLGQSKAQLIKPTYLQRRMNFNLPKGVQAPGKWARVRDEGDKITLTYKQVTNGDSIQDQHEHTVLVNNFNDAVELLKLLGCEPKAYQETKRELWHMTLPSNEGLEAERVEVTIDEWPFLDPFVEVEGKSESAVRLACEALGLDYSKAYFGAVDQLYAAKYGIKEELVNDHTPHLVFNMSNPFYSSQSGR